jgi:ABC-2 type transport system ATP-binding protein
MTSVIEVRGLVKDYGSVHAVRGIDLDIRAGEVFAFLGPNGAGKTTTVEILEGLRRKTSGDVRVLGRDPWTEGRELQRRIGVIPQEFHFFPKLTPTEAIDLYSGLFNVPSRSAELLQQVELSDKASARYDTLSGGQHQKVGLALALVNNPELCFLDEPTTGLDARARRSIWDVIQRLKAEGRTIFLTTHYLEEAHMLANRIAIINEGRIVATGTPDEIIATYGQPERLRIVADGALADRLRAEFRLPIEVVGDAVEIRVGSKKDAVRVIDFVEASGIPWQSFSTEQDTLEDVFIRLVGRYDDSAAPANGNGRAGR